MLKVVANRSPRQFKVAESIINNTIRLTDPVRVSYWVKYFGDNPHERLEDIQLIDSKVYNRIDDKSQVAKDLIRLNIRGVFPETYWSVEAALKTASRPSVWFSKPAHLAGGQGIEVIADADLKNYTLPQHHVLQEGIDNLRLNRGCKVVGRVYALVWNRGLYLFDRGFAIRHGEPYEKGSTDYSVQVDHRGYHDNSSGVEIKLASDFAETANLINEAVVPLRRCAHLFTALLSASNARRYILLGIDVLPLDNGSVKFVEINAIPNFSHNKYVDENLNTPFFTEALKVLCRRGSPCFQRVAYVRLASEGYSKPFAGLTASDA